MTPQDILDGILRITVLAALIRPAEFIEITSQQNAGILIKTAISKLIGENHGG
jgi:hypothetical protein